MARCITLWLAAPVATLLLGGSMECTSSPAPAAKTGAVESALHHLLGEPGEEPDEFDEDEDEGFWPFLP